MIIVFRKENGGFVDHETSGDARNVCRLKESL